MALLSGLGEITTNFLLNDFSVYVMNTTATGGYVSTEWELLGFTSAEKTINRNNEKYEKEGKIPRVLQYTKTIRKNLEVSFDLSNYNTTYIAELTQATKIDLGATGTKLSHGTTESAKIYRAYLFTADLDDGQHYNLVIDKGDAVQSGEQTLGGETETVFPLTIKATYNAAANATANLYSEYLITSSQNATSVLPAAF